MSTNIIALATERELQMQFYKIKVYQAILDLSSQQMADKCSDEVSASQIRNWASDPLVMVQDMEGGKFRIVRLKTLRSGSISV